MKKYENIKQIEDNLYVADATYYNKSGKVTSTQKVYFDDTRYYQIKLDQAILDKKPIEEIRSLVEKLINAAVREGERNAYDGTP